jgi:hypothetical protein
MSDVTGHLAQALRDLINEARTDSRRAGVVTVSPAGVSRATA